MGRSPCCDKDKVKRGPWSPDEDTILKNYIQNHGTGGNWIALPHKAGLKRCGKSCRLRWLNYLRPDIKLGGFTEEEDNIISSLYVNIGSRWSVIASKLHGRTDNDVKNHWNTKLKKKLSPSHNTTTSATPTPINQIQFSSPTFLPNQELNHYKTTYEPNFDHSTSMMLDYQETPITSESKNIVNVNRLSSQENHGLSPNAFPISNGYSSWYDINGGGVMGSGGDLLTGEFDFRQVLGEVANFDYASSWLSKVEEEMVKLI